MVNPLERYRSDPGQNTLQVNNAILDYFGINHTRWKLKQSIANHVEAQSLLAVKDILREYGIESAAIRKGSYLYTDFETPFVCAIQQEDWPQPAFTLVTNCENESIIYLDPLTNRLKETSIAEFEKIDKEVLLLLDDSCKKDESGYTDNKCKERTERIISQIPVSAFLLVVILSLYFQFTLMSTIHWLSVLFLLTATVGLIVSFLLVYREVDAHNPFIREICGGNKSNKLNCDAVLNSAGSQFLGISWSILGFAFFTTFFICQIIFSGNMVYTGLWSLLFLATFVYVPYSIYYQAKVVKQWCSLCLAIQVLIGSNAILAIIFLYHHVDSLTITLQPVFNVFFLGLFFLLLIYYGVPLLKKAKDAHNYEKRWKKLRYQPDVFQSLLQKGNRISISPEGLGIVVGSPEAKIEIVKVCNPYCNPCSKAHPELEHIVQNNPNLRLRIIFTASGEDNDIKTAPVAHLLAVQEKYGRKQVQQALDDWYLAPQKNYETFAAKYPMNGELKQQQNRIYAMWDWCNSMKIRATPTLYINGYELPESYRITELKNFL